MTVVGYRGKLNTAGVISALIKHANMTKNEAHTVAKKIESGQSVSFGSNFLLEEDLKDLGVLVSY